jgi:hypothetical protein
VSEGYRSRRPHGPTQASNPTYKQAVEEAEALLKGLEVPDPLELGKLQDTLARGDSTLVNAYGSEGVWWPALRFTSWDVSESMDIQVPAATGGEV